MLQGVIDSLIEIGIWNGMEMNAEKENECGKDLKGTILSGGDYDRP